MKNIVLGFAPTRRSIFSAPAATDQFFPIVHFVWMENFADRRKRRKHVNIMPFILELQIRADIRRCIV